MQLPKILKLDEDVRATMNETAKGSDATEAAAAARAEKMARARAEAVLRNTPVSLFTAYESAISTRWLRRLTMT